MQGISNSPDGKLVLRAVVLATDHDAIVAGLQAQVEQLQADLQSVSAMVAMLQEGEWAEHAGKGPVSKALEEAITELHNEQHELEAERDTLRAEVERLRADSERLTRLLGEEAMVYGYLSENVLSYGLIWPDGSSQADLFDCPRAAIDAAMEASR